MTRSAPAPGGPRPVRQETPPGTGLFGLKLFLITLTILFAASMAGYIVIAANNDPWPPEGFPGLPGGLWLSTLLLIGGSVTIHRAHRAARTYHVPGAVTRALATTTVLGILFLIAQSWNWWSLVQAGLPMNRDLFAFLFYCLTGLHFIHVIGGVIPLVIVTGNAGRGVYHAGHHPGIEYCALYWHFLDVIWVIIFLVLLFTT